MLTTLLPSAGSARALDFKWPAEGVARAPYRPFTDPEIYKLEQDRIFRGRSWNYICLDVEIPKAGDYRTTVIGETPVIVTRDQEGEVHAMVNRCAHKAHWYVSRSRTMSRALPASIMPGTTASMDN